MFCSWKLCAAVTLKDKLAKFSCKCGELGLSLEAEATDDAVQSVKRHLAPRLLGGAVAGPSWLQSMSGSASVKRPILALVPGLCQNVELLLHAGNLNDEARFPVCSSCVVFVPAREMVIRLGVQVQKFVLRVYAAAVKSDNGARVKWMLKEKVEHLFLAFVGPHAKFRTSHHLFRAAAHPLGKEKQVSSCRTWRPSRNT